MLGPEGFASTGWGFVGGGGVGQLVEENSFVAWGPLQESVGGVGLAGAADLATPEASELGRVDGVTWHGYMDHVGAC